MKRLFFLSFFVAACDPLLSIDATIVVTPEVQDALTYPQEIVVDFGSNFGIRRTFILCEASDLDVIINASEGGIGCAEETTLRVWATPFIPAEGEEIICGEQPFFTASESVAPLETDPAAEQIIFTDVPDVLVGCAGGSETLDLTLSF